MRLAIMQPYFLPYIGYFKLLAEADRLVLLDDVNFISRGWINRNRIAINGVIHWLTIPLETASQNRLINEIRIAEDPVWKAKMIRKVDLSYRPAPHWDSVLPFFARIIEAARGPLSPFLLFQLRLVANYLDLPVSIEPTSAVYPKEGLSGQDRILDICRREGAKTYLNLSGGRELYDSNAFAANGIKLRFVEVNLADLRLQYSGHEGPCLSILDLLMLNAPSAVRKAIAPAAS
jgi:hypothetical protein